jgi:hypothetical protein
LRSDEKNDNPWEDEMVGLPESEPEWVQESDRYEMPVDTLDNGFMGRRKELVNYEA